MGSYSNFKNFNDLSLPEVSGEKTTMDVPLVSQSSIYSLTFDEFQTTLGGLGKDFGSMGSMNMDELLKNIWTAEETQAFASSGFVGGGLNAPSGSVPLQKQGSLTLPRTLSQKTVDDVWKDLFKDGADAGSSTGGGGGSGSKLEQRQATLGEMTLEEFLLRAGIVREDNNIDMNNINNNGFYAGLPQPTNNNVGLSLNFQQPTNQNSLAMYDQINENVISPATTNKTPILPFSIAANSTTRSTQPIFPKQTTNMTFASPVVTNHEVRGPVVGRINNPILNNSLLSTGITRVVNPVDSPLNQLSPDVKSGLDTPSYSPPSFAFNGGAVRTRKCGANVEKAMERRHKRMIKNRESAARSRERKQAYTLELEAEIAKLKEINQQLQKEQEEIMEAQKNKLLETVKAPWTSKRVCLRRTLTGPW